MDFEYRIFKFVPQVDRFVNEQMQFKLQECSYNKASTFEIDDDYADDYDFGLYQGDRSKARKHADNLIYKLCENQEYSIDEKEHMDYDSVKEHLAVMLVNTQANKRMLQEMPHENMEDLSAICYVDFPVESNDGKATMKVKNEHLKMWNVDAKEMFQQARANTQPVNTPILQSMDEMLLSIFNEEGHATNLLDENVDFGLRSHDMLYALTNVEKQYGASMITQPEVLNKLEQLFPEGFYVLPSSVHEVLIVPDNGEMEPKMLGEMVREVNKNEVERQEVLSDRVYSYDKEKHQIRQEPDSIQKVKEMER